MNTLRKIVNLLFYNCAYVYLVLKSQLSKIKCLYNKSTVVWEKPYAGQKIVLLALHEKGILRSDIENLLNVLKHQNVYTICINTAQFNNAEQYESLMDCYIERYNFGRDFGSYKEGFTLLFKRCWHEKCPRLIMLNDSVFYSKKTLTTYIENLLQTDIEVLSSTENHDIEHHLGSFSLSLHGNIIRNNKFQQYWKKYVNSNARPLIIKNGEMQLSKTLRQCASSPENFSALYDLTWLSEYLDNNKEFLDIAPHFYHSSDFHNWKRPSLNNVANQLRKKHVISEFGTSTSETNSPIYFVDSPKALQQAIMASTDQTQSNNIESKVYDEVKNDLLACFSTGSQIHQNAIMLHHLGLPIIKLDGLYRGMFSAVDTERLAQQLESDEVKPFRRLMYSRPYGGDVFIGLKKLAFKNWLI